jgi:TRAP-type C4-dicarboxylate transport system permease small subunit
VRRFLDRLYAGSGALAALCLAGIFVVMMAQSLMRTAGFLFRGADDIVAWLCAASAFFALAYTFRHGDLVRVSLLIHRLSPARRRAAELICLGAAALVVGYMTWATGSFVYQSWQFGELAQGLIQIPIWIPQLGVVLGTLVLEVAVLDELVSVMRGGKPSYQRAEEERLARKDFSENV